MRLLASLAIVLALCASAEAQENFRADSGLSVKSNIIANNTTAIVISTVPSRVYIVEAFNNSTTLAYIKLYNAVSATCGQATPLPVARYMIPFGQSSSGGGFALPNINGDAYVNGVTMCVTTGQADSDTGAPAATTYIVNIHFKAQQPAQ